MYPGRIMPSKDVSYPGVHFDKLKRDRRVNQHQYLKRHRNRKVFKRWDNFIFQMASIRQKQNVETNVANDFPTTYCTEICVLNSIACKSRIE